MAFSIWPGGAWPFFQVDRWHDVMRYDHEGY
jgi:hypothetical protein